MFRGAARLACLVVCVLTVTAIANAGGPPALDSRAWQTGWDIFDEPLNIVTSKVQWTVNTNKAMSIQFLLFGARPSKLYEVGIHTLNTCSKANPPTSFGRFPVANNGRCDTITRQGITRTVQAVELGAILTDAKGNGWALVNTAPIASGTYTFEYTVRNGAGCNVTGGGGGATCSAVFQSPGPFATGVTVNIP